MTPTATSYADRALAQIMDDAYCIRRAELIAVEEERVQELDRQERLVQKELDELCRWSCMMREAIIHEHAAQGLPRTGQIRRVEAEQAEHREEDLARLRDTLNEKIKRAKTLGACTTAQERLWKVEHANAKFPLEPQIGFDPDEI